MSLIIALSDSSWVVEFCVLELWYSMGDALGSFGFAFWMVKLVGKFHSRIWNMIPSCLIWTLWRERNRHVFEDEEHLDSQLLEFFSNLLFDWATVWGYTQSTTVISFFNSLHFSHP